MTVNKEMVAKYESQRTALLCQAVVAYTEPLITCVGRMDTAEWQMWELHHSKDVSKLSE